MQISDLHVIGFSAINPPSVIYLLLNDCIPIALYERFYLELSPLLLGIMMKY